MWRFLDKENYFAFYVFLCIVFFYTFSVSFVAEKIKHHIYPIIFGATGALVTMILLALGITRRRCRLDNNTRERGMNHLWYMTNSF